MPTQYLEALTRMFHGPYPSDESILPPDAEGFHPLLPQMTAQSQGVHPELIEGNGVGLFGKAMGALGLDAEGHRAAQPWGNALMQTAGTVIDPVGTAGHFVGGLDQSLQDLDRLLQHPSHDPEWGRAVAGPAFDLTSAVAMGGGAVPKAAAGEAMGRDIMLGRALDKAHPREIAGGTSDYLLRTDMLPKPGDVPNMREWGVPPLTMTDANGWADNFVMSHRSARDADLFERSGYTPFRPPLNEEMTQPLSAYDREALNQQWRDKVKRTGELFSNSKEASAPGIVDYHGSPHVEYNDRPTNGLLGGLDMTGKPPEPDGLLPKSGGMGGASPVLAETRGLSGGPTVNPGVFDVADQVAHSLGMQARHHPTSFGKSSYIGNYRISDHSVGSGRYATEGPGFDYLLGAEEILRKINAGRQQQIAELLNAPPPQRQPWMSGRDWYEERQRYNNRRPGWLSQDEWEEIKNKHAGAGVGGLMPAR